MDVAVVVIVEARGSFVSEMSTFQQCDLPPKGWYCTLEDGHDGPCPTHPCQWKLRVEQLDRSGALAFWGWRWEWSVREWDGSALWYMAPDLFDWRGQCRTKEAAIVAAECALVRFRDQRAQRQAVTTVWYVR